ncbi:MAG: hypothetical protein EPN86_02000 [Nanoarchaeota archaeon]|nr:MAG: hypothetical protein EPN86_02000 [Nanoarchaeota archaeon]
MGSEIEHGFFYKSWRPFKYLMTAPYRIPSLIREVATLPKTAYEYLRDNERVKNSLRWSSAGYAFGVIGAGFGYAAQGEIYDAISNDALINNATNAGLWILWVGGTAFSFKHELGRLNHSPSLESIVDVEESGPSQKS